MTEQQYKAFGWILFFGTVALALYWCANASGPAGFFMNQTERLTGNRLVQISWLLTFAIVCLPGWMLKNYFEGLAWNAHVKSMPPPDPRESARKSKYVKVDDLPLPPPKPVKLDEIAKGQEEFIATCPACGNFFSAKKGAGELKCPSCGEAVPVV